MRFRLQDNIAIGKSSEIGDSKADETGEEEAPIYFVTEFAPERMRGKSRNLLNEEKFFDCLGFGDIQDIFRGVARDELRPDSSMENMDHGAVVVRSGNLREGWAREKEGLEALEPIGIDCSDLDNACIFC
jgi:hypothetical protein